MTESAGKLHIVAPDRPRNGRKGESLGNWCVWQFIFDAVARHFSRLAHELLVSFESSKGVHRSEVCASQLAVVFLSIEFVLENVCWNRSIG